MSDNPLNDPEFVQGVCKTCGIPVETSSVNVIYDRLGQPLYGKNAEPHRWEHMFPDTVEGEASRLYHFAKNTPINHPAEPSDNRTHEQDGERIRRQGYLDHMEQGFNLSRQFDDLMGRGERE